MLCKSDIENSFWFCLIPSIETMFASTANPDHFMLQFGIMQYSSRFRIEMDFNYFRTSGWSSRINEISQQRGATFTPTAIREVVNKLFVPNRGARPDAVKVLLVITDGKTSGDDTPLSDVVNEAERKGIIRYAIGVLLWKIMCHYV
uniref:VWFA domain-containing protein n=1 Tax=Paramormyrops kingsleyae TaxID=1676925 RepID=A0A3B3S990_9TELE